MSLRFELGINDDILINNPVSRMSIQVPIWSFITFNPIKVKWLEKRLICMLSLRQFCFLVSCNSQQRMHCNKIQVPFILFSRISLRESASRILCYRINNVCLYPVSLCCCCLHSYLTWPSFWRSLILWMFWTVLFGFRFWL